MVSAVNFASEAVLIMSEYAISRFSRLSARGVFSSSRPRCLYHRVQLFHISTDRSSTDRSSTDRSSRSQSAVVSCCAGSVYRGRYSTEETVLDHAGFSTPTRQHDLCRSYRSGIYISTLKDLDHQIIC